MRQDIIERFLEINNFQDNGLNVHHQDLYLPILKLPILKISEEYARGHKFNTSLAKS